MQDVKDPKLCTHDWQFKHAGYGASYWYCEECDTWTEELEDATP